MFRLKAVVSGIKANYATLKRRVACARMVSVEKGWVQLSSALKENDRGDVFNEGEMGGNELNRPLDPLPPAELGSCDRKGAVAWAAARSRVGEAKHLETSRGE